WFALFPSLRSRVKDPKHELSGLFDAASGDLWQAAGAAHEEGLPAAECLAEAIGRRPVDWAGWLDAGGQALDPDLAGDLLKTMRPPGEAIPAQLRLIVLRLADISGDIDIWLQTLPQAHRHLPEVGAQIARRLLAAGRSAEARLALDASRPKPAPRRWGGGRAAEPTRCPDWEAADIAVLEAEGRTAEAQTARWAMFERDLS